MSADLHGGEHCHPGTGGGSGCLSAFYF